MEDSTIYFCPVCDGHTWTEISMPRQVPGGHEIFKVFVCQGCSAMFHDLSLADAAGASRQGALDSRISNAIELALHDHGYRCHGEDSDR